MAGLRSSTRGDLEQYDGRESSRLQISRDNTRLPFRGLKRIQAGILGSAVQDETKTGKGQMDSCLEWYNTTCRSCRPTNSPQSFRRRPRCSPLLHHQPRGRQHHTIIMADIGDIIDKSTNLRTLAPAAVGTQVGLMSVISVSPYPPLIRSEV